MTRRRLTLPIPPRILSPIDPLAVSPRAVVRSGAAVRPSQQRSAVRSFLLAPCSPRLTFPPPPPSLKDGSAQRIDPLRRDFAHGEPVPPENRCLQDARRQAQAFRHTRRETV